MSAATPDRGDVLTAALAAHHAGLNVLPPKADGSKQPDTDEWKSRQTTRATVAEIERWYANGRTGLGVVCGAVSGGLELFDFDCGDTWRAFQLLAEDTGLSGLLARVEDCYLEETPCGGVHLFYYCAKPATGKLARREKLESEKRDPQDRIKTLIETKGEAGYAVTAPSHGRVHPTGEAYKLVRGGFDSIIRLTDEERDALHALARTFDTLGKETSTKREQRKGNAARPGDDFNARTTWEELLGKHGWRLLFSRSGEDFWTRPGKSAGISATTGYAGSDLLYVFSTSTVFEAERSYDRFGAYAVLEHGGDLEAAARALAAKGYGEQREERDGRNDAGEEPKATPSARVVRLVSVTPERVSWLWPGRIPLGKLSILDGDPGLGKSLLTLDLGARVSTGDRMPDGTPGIEGGAGVVLLSAEDGLGDTIRPRLESAGAKLAKVVALTAMPTEDGDRMPELPGDVLALEKVIRETEARLVVVDPLMAFLAGDTNANRDHDVRRALAPLAGIAEATGAAVLVVRHLNKGSTGTNPLYRGGGSIGIIGAARSGLLAARDPDDPERRVLAVTKANLAAPVPALRWRIVDGPRGLVVEWGESCEHSAATLMSEPEGEERGARDEAAEWLRDVLGDGPIAAGEIRKRARADGIADRTLDRAKARLKAKAAKAGFDGGWTWSL